MYIASAQLTFCYRYSQLRSAFRKMSFCFNSSLVCCRFQAFELTPPIGEGFLSGSLARATDLSIYTRLTYGITPISVLPNCVTTV